MVGDECECPCGCDDEVKSSHHHRCNHCRVASHRAWVRATYPEQTRIHTFRPTITTKTLPNGDRHSTIDWGQGAVRTVIIPAGAMHAGGALWDHSWIHDGAVDASPNHIVGYIEDEPDADAANG